MHDSFLKAKFRNKVFILLGGVAMNFIAAWVIFTIGFWHGVQPIQVIPDNFIAGKSESLLMPTYNYLQSQGFVSGTVVTGAVQIVEVLSGEIASQVGLLS